MVESMDKSKDYEENNQPGRQNESKSQGKMENEPREEYFSDIREEVGTEKPTRDLNDETVDNPDPGMGTNSDPLNEEYYSEVDPRVKDSKDEDKVNNSDFDEDSEM